jgi:hypothetical protein
MGFTAAVASCYLKFLTFSGRAPRSEYWWFIVFQLLMATASVVGMMLWLMPGGQPDTSKLAYLQTAEANIVYLVFWALLYIPGLSVTVRRLHDIDRSGWWLAGPDPSAGLSGADLFLRPARHRRSQPLRPRSGPRRQQSGCPGRRPGQLQPLEHPARGPRRRLIRQ